jgi:hypothetical protein
LRLLFPEYKQLENVKALLEQMHSLVSGTELQKGQYQPWVMQAQLRKLMEIKHQTPGMRLVDKFAKDFDDQLVVFEREWGKMIPYRYNSDDEAVQLAARSQFLACLLLGNADRDRYKEFIDELANDHNLGNDNYPKDVPSMVSMLSNQRGAVSTKKIDEMKDGI